MCFAATPPMPGIVALSGRVVSAFFLVLKNVPLQNTCKKVRQSYAFFSSCRLFCASKKHPRACRVRKWRVELPIFEPLLSHLEGWAGARRSDCGLLVRPFPEKYL